VTAIWDWDYAVEIVPALLQGLWLTFLITCVAGLIALVTGWFLAIVRRSRVAWARVPATFLLNLVRGTPLVVQLFAAFYVLPAHGITLSPFTAGVIVLGLHFSCFTAEVYRAGIEQVPGGQWDAAHALSLSPARVWMRVVLPQVIRSSAPAIGNYVVGMYKETAILFAIGLPVLLGTAQAAGNASYRFLEPYTIAALLYLLVSYPTSVLVRRWEART
jgi:polar amino acid transport system permease protein